MSGRALLAAARPAPSARRTPRNSWRPRAPPTSAPVRAPSWPGRTPGRGVLRRSGSDVHSPDGEVHVPAVAGVSGNPTGAGDAATAGLVLALVRGLPTVGALRWAAAFGAAAVLRPTGRRGGPRRPRPFLPDLEPPGQEPRMSPTPFAELLTGARSAGRAVVRSTSCCSSTRRRWSPGPSAPACPSSCRSARTASATTATSRRSPPRPWRWRGRRTSRPGPPRPRHGRRPRHPGLDLGVSSVMFDASALPSPRTSPRRGRSRTVAARGSRVRGRTRGGRRQGRCARPRRPHGPPRGGRVRGGDGRRRPRRRRGDVARHADPGRQRRPGPRRGAGRRRARPPRAARVLGVVRRAAAGRDDGRG